MDSGGPRDAAKSPARTGAAPVRPTEQILDELRAGIDREANQRRLFRRYFRLVRHSFRRRGWSPQEVDDLCQETFLHLFRGLDSFRGEARFETWLLRIADNAHREQLRRATTAKRAAEETSLDALPLVDDSLTTTTTQEPEASPLRRLLGKEQAQAVLDALDTLPPQMGQCMLLRFTQELSYEEIAAVLQLSVGSVKTQVHRGRKRLQEALARQFEPTATRD